MKDRTVPCEFYVCAHEECKKGRKDVTLKSTCKNCDKYRPRKTGNPVKESYKSRKGKSVEKDLQKYRREL